MLAGHQAAGRQAAQVDSGVVTDARTALSTSENGPKLMRQRAPARLVHGDGPVAEPAALQVSEDETRGCPKLATLATIGGRKSYCSGD